MSGDLEIQTIALAARVLASAHSVWLIVVLIVVVSRATRHLMMDMSRRLLLEAKEWRRLFTRSRRPTQSLYRAPAAPQFS